MRDESIIREHVRRQLRRRRLFAQFIGTLVAVGVLSTLIESGTIPRGVEFIIPLLVVIFVIRAVSFALLDGESLGFRRRFREAMYEAYGDYDRRARYKQKRLGSRMADYDDEYMPRRRRRARMYEDYDDYEDEDDDYEEKPKRDGRMGLSDDGELVQIADDEWDAEDEQAYGRL